MPVLYYKTLYFMCFVSVSDNRCYKIIISKSVVRINYLYLITCSNKDGETEFSIVQELDPIQRTLDERPKPRTSYEDPRDNIDRRIPK